MLHIKNLKKTYNNKLVVNISDFIFEENNLYAVLGENGSGKSTVSKLIAGIINENQIFLTCFSKPSDDPPAAIQVSLKFSDSLSIFFVIVFFIM